MTIHYQDDLVTLHAGDCLHILTTLPDGSVDAVVTDPPYGLEFMGKDWDRFDRKIVGFRSASAADLRRIGIKRGSMPDAYVAGAHFQVWCEQWAAECLRVLKPGGHLLAFGGTRTWHRLAVAIEDAGFEIRDSIAWMYGSGFPKSLDVSKAIDKAAGAEREPRALGATSCNFLAHGLPCQGHGDQGKSQSGATVHTLPTAPSTPDAARWQGWGTALKPAHEPIVVARKPLTGTVAANVLEHGTGALNIDACRIGTEILVNQSGGIPNGAGNYVGTDKTRDRALPPRVAFGRWPANVVLDEDQAAALDQQSGMTASRPFKRKDGPAKFGGTFGNGQPVSSDAMYDDAGGASRFFYTAKAATGERPRVDGIAHPTVKPLTLMRWLVRLVTPPGGLVLDPFAGSGTTAEACTIEGFRCVTIERELDYLPLIVQRLTKPTQPTLGTP